MNLMINTYCNLNCSYCFADPTMKDVATKNMSLEDFEYALSFLEKVGEKTVRLIGGEPTISPNLELFIDKIIKRGTFKAIIIFSNFCFEEKTRKMLLRKNKLIPITFLPNINEFNLMIDKFVKNINENLDAFTKSNGVRCIGINIYDPNMKLDQWENLIKKYRNYLDSIRFSIAIPTKQIFEKKFVFQEYYSSFEKVISDLVDIAERNSIRLNCDCSDVPVCCFSPNLVYRMYRIGASSLGVTNGRIGCSYPVVDVRPDLSIATCFGYTNEKQGMFSLKDFNNYKEIIDWCASVAKTDRIARIECLSCPRYKTYGTSCACKSTHLIKKEQENE